jgi:hypothetical protein
MANQEKLRDRAVAKIEKANGLLNERPNAHASYALNHLRDAKQELGSIKFELVRAERKAGQSTKESLAKPVDKALSALTMVVKKKNDGDLEFLARMNPGNVPVLEVVASVRRLARRAKSDVTLMCQPVRRTLMSGWVPLVILVVAISYGVAHYYIRGHAPMGSGHVATLQGVGEKSREIVQQAGSGNNIVKPITEVLVDLKALFSAVPPLLTALAAALAACQRFAKVSA